MSTEESVWKVKPWLGPIIVFLSAMVLFSLNLDRPPQADELFHVMAAQHLLETGHPIIAEGEYWRGILYTWLVAVSYEIFGDSLSSARLPAALLVALIAPILFVWIRQEAGALAAWITTFLFISSPFVVEIAQFSRFYAPQMMFFTGGGICAYYAAVPTESPLRRIALAFIAVVMFALAIWLQETTLIGLIGVIVWAAGLVIASHVRGPTTGWVVWRVSAILLIIVAVLLLAALIYPEEIVSAWRRFRFASLFAQGRTDQFWFYHYRYILFYPTLWPLFGVLALLAALKNLRLAWFAVAIFAVSFLLTSFAAQKATRYFSYVQPLLAVIWGVGIAYALPACWRWTERTRIQLADSLAASPHSGIWISRALILTAAAVVILMNPFWLRTATLIGNIAMPMENPTTNWRAARQSLAPWTSGADIMVTTEELGAMYFLGRSDVRYSPTKFSELPDNQRFEFGIDSRVGRPVISTPESLQRLIECFDSGFVVGPLADWGNPVVMDNAVQRVLLRNAHPIQVPTASYLYAWGWKRPPSGSKPGYCADLKRFSGRRQRSLN